MIKKVLLLCAGGTTTHTTTTTQARRGEKVPVTGTYTGVHAVHPVYCTRKINEGSVVYRTLLENVWWILLYLTDDAIAKLYVT